MIVKGQYTFLSSFTETFLSNINNIVISGAKHNGDIPRFAGTSYYNGGSPSVYVAYSNPEAIPASDLDSVGAVLAAASPAEIGEKGTVMYGGKVYDVLCNIVRKLTRVRKFTSKWYHTTNGTSALMSTVSGKALFKEKLSTLPVYPGAASSRNCGWKRTVNDPIQNISVNNAGVAKGNYLYASSVNNFFTNLNNAWLAAAENPIEYTLYSCHNNCHGNCNCDGRHRR